MNRSYCKLVKFPTFEERLRYLQLDGTVGHETFGYKRWLNQMLYRSPEWRRFRDKIIARDNGCDLGMDGYDILYEPILIHHLNPITYDDVLQRAPCVFDPENAITTRLSTHNLIHYAHGDIAQPVFIERYKNDTCPWRK